MSRIFFVTIPTRASKHVGGGGMAPIPSDMQHMLRKTMNWDKRGADEDQVSLLGAAKHLVAKKSVIFDQFRAIFDEKQG